MFRSVFNFPFSRYEIDATRRAKLRCRDEWLSVLRKRLYCFEMITPLKKLKTLARVEEIWILRTLLTMNFNLTNAAGALGISVRTLRKRVKQYRAKGWKIPMYKPQRNEENEL